MSNPTVRSSKDSEGVIQSKKVRRNILSTRRTMRLRIVQRLRTLCKEDRQRKSIPHMAKKLENVLYISAMSFEEYIDLSTLNPRLEMISLGLKRLQQQQAPAIPQE
mmetsp:Transcript_8660/g.11285  ORF Transcript_8660/g.11285 Transcript_8660/m.11285 type:complete len:106 (+) Transcript_8660:58-375(+)